MSTPRPSVGQNVTSYVFQNSGPRGSASGYLQPAVLPLLPELRPGMRVLDVGCGNGYWAGWFLEHGCEVVGIDPSESGIEIARKANPKGRFENRIVTKQILQDLNEPPFDLVVSFEVVEHLYSPLTWAQGCFSSLKPGGLLICSTPYHGYLKNIALAVSGHWDKHHGPLNEGGHVKFWSHKTLDRLLMNAGFETSQFQGAGRCPWLWKSMVLSSRRPFAS